MDDEKWEGLDRVAGADAERRSGTGSGAGTVADADAGAEPASQEAQRTPDTISQLRAMSKAEKIHAAMHGGRDLRAAIARDLDRSLHPFLLKNPALALDEVAAYARIASFSVDALNLIARHERWGRDASIVTSLIRNPKSPVTLAIALLERVGREELRRIAKGQGVRDPIAFAARKKIERGG